MEAGLGGSESETRQSRAGLQRACDREALLAGPALTQGGEPGDALPGAAGAGRGRGLTPRLVDRSPSCRPPSGGRRSGVFLGPDHFPVRGAGEYRWWEGGNSGPRKNVMCCEQSLVRDKMCMPFSRTSRCMVILIFKNFGIL